MLLYHNKLYRIRLNIQGKTVVVRIENENSRGNFVTAASFNNERLI